jgi:thymidylate synthase ThyX
MTLSQESRTRISPFVSNLDRPVFAITGLPEEVIAVLLAYYSRSRDDLRTNLDRLIADDALGISAPSATAPSRAEDKARAFHEKWVVGYGHASVAEHAVVHLAVEQVSIVASKVIEDLRLGSYTEKSTRYVVFDTGSFADLPALPGPLRDDYRAACKDLFSTYLELFPDVEARLEQLVPTEKGQSPARRAAAIRAHACDLLRGLLPASTLTNLGITANARALGMLLSKMLSSPLDEVRHVAEQMRTEAATVAPTLLRHVETIPYRETLRDSIANAIPWNLVVPRTDSPAAPVRIIRHDSDALQRVVLALTYDLAVQPHAGDRMKMLDRQDDSTLAKIVRAAFANRGPHDPAPRAMESSNITIELELDYGAYRDLQRHRLLTPTTQVLGCTLGPTLPQDLRALGIHDRYEQALEGVRPAWERLTTHDPFAAQYVVPLAYRVRTLWTLNLREVFHVVELRSARQGHANYRRVAQALYHEVCRVHPWLADLIRVDLADHAIARS